MLIPRRDVDTMLRTRWEDSSQSTAIVVRVVDSHRASFTANLGIQGGEPQPRSTRGNTRQLRSLAVRLLHRRRTASAGLGRASM